MNKVSVIIPVYNGQEYISSCVQSLINQTYQDLEIIFINDGSSDKTLDQIKQYKSSILSKGFNLIVLSQKNQGAGYAASLGLQHATGDFITCFDVDDYLYPESIEKKVRFLITCPEYDIVRTNGYEILGNKKKLFVTNEQEKNESNIFYSLLFGKTNNWAGSYMIRAKALWKIYPNQVIPGSRYGQNLQLLLATSYESKSGFIDEPLMKYIRNENSFTGKNKKLKEELELLDGFRQIRNQVLNILKIKDPNINQKLDIFYAQRKKQLGIDYTNHTIFFQYFSFLEANHSLNDIDYFYYYKFKNKSFIAFYYRLKNKLKQLLFSIK